MQPAIVLVFCIFAMRSCELISSPIKPGGGMNSTFSLADTNGLPATSFHAGESFDCRFVISNLTDQDQVYYHTGPTVIFEIRQGDSTVATSVDGLAWIQVVLTGSISKGQSETQAWRAPNSPGRDPKIDLLPGRYSAGVQLRYDFKDVKITPPNEVPFTVLP